MSKIKVGSILIICLVVAGVGYMWILRSDAINRTKIGSCTNHISQLDLSASFYINEFAAPPFIEGGNEVDTLQILSSFGRKGPIVVSGCPLVQKGWLMDDWSKIGYRIRNWSLSEWKNFRDFLYTAASKEYDREYHVPFLWCAQIHDRASLLDRIMDRHKFGRNVLFIDPVEYYIDANGARVYIRSGERPLIEVETKWDFYNYLSFIEETTFQNLCLCIIDYKQLDSGMTKPTD